MAVICTHCGADTTTIIGYEVSNLSDMIYYLETKYQDTDEALIKEKPPLCKEEKLAVEINCPIAFNYAVPAPDT